MDEIRHNFTKIIQRYFICYFQSVAKVQDCRYLLHANYHNYEMSILIVVQEPPLNVSIYFGSIVLMANVWSPHIYNDSRVELLLFIKQFHNFTANLDYYKHCRWFLKYLILIELSTSRVGASPGENPPIECKFRQLAARLGDSPTNLGVIFCNVLSLKSFF